MRKLILLLLITSFYSCNWFELPEDATTIDKSTETNSIESLDIPEGFDFSTFTKTNVIVESVANNGTPLQNVPFQLFYEEVNPKQLLFSGSTGDTGAFEFNLDVASFTGDLILTTNYPGLPNRYEFPSQVANTRIVMGDPSSPFVVQSISGLENPNLARAARNRSVDLRSTSFSYMGAYNNQGVPNYLEANDEVVGQNILDLIANSLPEGQPVPDYNPQYIEASVNASTSLQGLADVWVTFVHEGAGYRNALGYYTYATGNPPSSPEEVNNFSIIFPNVSYAGSGGGLRTGNRVYLGQFPAGTSIGWFLIPNGWNPSDQLVEPQEDKPTKYSNKNFNDFTDQAYQNHTVLLKSEEEEILLLGFEDISRPGGDNDFNDAIFLVSANPFSAISTDGLVAAQTASADGDGDGVADVNDEFTNDPDIAFANHAPAQGQFASLAFEDQWPQKGDYDMNDMVVDYNFIEYRNSNNRTIKLRGTFVLHAMGAGFQNGFGIELDVPPSSVAAVSGSVLKDNFIQLAANGVETGQEKAVIIVFDNGHKIMRNPEGGFVNTEPGRPQVESDTIIIDIELQTPQLASQLGVAPYNPFIIKNRQRGTEIHLLNGRPTSKANLSLFGTGNDFSKPNEGIYYVTRTGLPWAIKLARPFSWPVEKERVDQAYLKFGDWAESGGFNFPDWYLDNPGYRNGVKIY